jgi:hypothetical protein
MPADLARGATRRAVVGAAWLGGLGVPAACGGVSSSPEQAAKAVGPATVSFSFWGTQERADRRSSFS